MLIHMSQNDIMQDGGILYFHLIKSQNKISLLQTLSFTFEDLIVDLYYRPFSTDDFSCYVPTVYIIKLLEFLKYFAFLILQTTVCFFFKYKYYSHMFTKCWIVWCNFV